jgi:hypothetical protein
MSIDLHERCPKHIHVFRDRGPNIMYHECGHFCANDKARDGLCCLCHPTHYGGGQYCFICRQDNP